MINGCLYVKIFDNGKMYVGITNNFNKRMREHKRASANGSELFVHSAMRKHSHYTEIWADGIDDRELLCQIEMQTIAQLKDIGIELYNLTDGGDGTNGYWRGRHMSEETKRKISEKIRGKNHPMYGKKGILNPKYGKQISEKAKENIRNALKGKRTKEKYYNGKEHPMYGKTGQSNPNAKDKSYFEKTSVFRGNFKKTCIRNGWNIADFEEIEDGWYVYPSGDRKRKYRYVERK